MFIKTLLCLHFMHLTQDWRMILKSFLCFMFFPIFFTDENISIVYMGAFVPDDIIACKTINTNHK